MLGSLMSAGLEMGLPTQLHLAYLDPGTGSLIAQAVVGTVVAAGLALKVYWFKVKSFFSRTPAVAADAKPTGLAAEQKSETPEGSTDA